MHQHVAVRHLESEQAGQPRTRKCCRRGVATRVAVDRRAGRLRAQLPQQGTGPGHRHRRESRIDAALEPRAGLGFQAQRLAGAAHRRRIEGGAFEHHRPRRGGHFGVGSAHHAGDGDRRPGVGDHQHVGCERALLAVQRPDLLAGGGHAHADGRAHQPSHVEGVHRLASSSRHVVGYVHDVVDGTHAARAQPGLQPLRRRRHRYRDEGADVAAAQVGRSMSTLNGSRVPGVSVSRLAMSFSGRS